MAALRIPSFSRPALLRLNLVALAAVAVFFRLWGLDHLPGVNGDEAWYGVKCLELLQGKSTSWLTPTNNVLNPLYFGPTLALHSVAGPSLALLRVTAVLSGLAALALNFCLCRRVFDFRTAVLSTAILAVLPTNIAYSRFGWDPSQTLLVTVLVMYIGLQVMRTQRPRPWLLAGAVAYGIAMLVHPANIFLGPLLAIPGLVQAKDQARRAFDPRGPIRCWAPTYAIALAASVFVVVFGSHWIQRVGERFLQPADAIAFSEHFVRLFSGVTVYDFLSGAYAPGYETASGEPWRVMYDLSWFVLAGALAAGLIGGFGGAAIAWNLAWRPATASAWRRSSWWAARRRLRRTTNDTPSA